MKEDDPEIATTHYPKILGMSLLRINCLLFVKDHVMSSLYPVTLIESSLLGL